MSTSTITTVNTAELNKLIDICKNSWTIHQKTTAKRAMKYLTEGTTAIFKKNIEPSYKGKNANSSFKNGKMITDSVA